MQFEYLWLSLAVIARLCYLAVIFAVLWVHGYLWAILAIATACLAINIFFSLPLTMNLPRFARFVATVDDDDEEEEEEEEEQKTEKFPPTQKNSPQSRRK